MKVFRVKQLTPAVLFIFLIITSTAYSISPVKSADIELTCFEKKGVWENFELLDRDITAILDKKGQILFFSNSGILLKSVVIPESGYPSAIRRLPYKKGNSLFICDTLNKKLITLKDKDSLLNFHNFIKNIYPVDITFSKNYYYILDNRNLSIVQLNQELKPSITFALKGFIDKKDLLTSLCMINNRLFITSWYGKLYVCSIKNNEIILDKKIEFKSSSFTSISKSDDDKLIITDLIGRVIYYSLKNKRIEEQITGLTNPVDAFERNNRLYILNSGNYSIKVYKKLKSVVSKKKESLKVPFPKKKLEPFVKKVDPDVAKHEKLKRKIVIKKTTADIHVAENNNIEVKEDKSVITNLDTYNKRFKLIKFDKDKLFIKLFFDFDDERYRFSDDSKNLREKLSFDNVKIFFDLIECQLRKIKILSKRNNYILLEFQMIKHLDPDEIILILKWNYDIIQKKFKIKK